MKEQYLVISRGYILGEISIDNNPSHSPPPTPLPPPSLPPSPPPSSLQHTCWVEITSSIKVKEQWIVVYQVQQDMCTTYLLHSDILKNSIKINKQKNK